jgi:ribonuclease J
MKLTIHRGTKEIGGSCVEIATETTRLIVDIGLPLVNANREPFDRDATRNKTLQQLVEAKIAPSVPGLFVDGPSPDAILLSHSHLDHVGLLSNSDDQIPVYATSGTSKMMLAGSVFAGQASVDRNRFRQISSRESFTIGDITITPYSVDHSSYGAVAFLIESGGKSLLYSGDLRFHGRKPGMIKSLIEEVAPKNVDALVMEGTHFGSKRPERKTEYQLEDEICDQIRQAGGLVLASFSPMDVDRLITYYKATVKSGRTFVVDAYTAFVMHLVQSEIPIPHPSSAEKIKVYFNHSFARRNLKKVSSRFEGNQIRLSEVLASENEYVLCFRPSNLRLDFDHKLPMGSTLFYSYWHGYLEKPDWLEVQQHLETVNGTFIKAHTSGHIYVEDIAKFVNGINAKTVIPIHTFEPEKFQELFSNAKQLSDGIPERV